MNGAVAIDGVSPIGVKVSGVGCGFDGSTSCGWPWSGVPVPTAGSADPGAPATTAALIGIAALSPIDAEFFTLIPSR